MTLLDDAVTIFEKVINLLAPASTDTDDDRAAIAREQAAIAARYQHLIGRAVVWQAPSTRRYHGIVCEIMVDDDFNVWLKADYEFAAFDDPRRMITSSACMWASSFKLPDRQGLEYSMNNIDALPVAA